MKILLYIIISIGGLLSTGCHRQVEIDRILEYKPTITPDYAEVTFPPNMAPPTFALTDENLASEYRVVCRAGEEEVIVRARKGTVRFNTAQWRRLAKAETIALHVQAKRNDRWEEYAPFHIYIAREEIDPYIAYRLIEPGYETWNEMGIYQRCLESYDESAIITNKSTGHGCMNCHSFCQQNPEKMLFHLRSDYGGTYLTEGDDVKKLNTKTPETISALVYPSWHPSGNYVAFSVNDTKQLFHTTDRNRIEVMDYESDVVVYDVKRDQIVTSPLLSAKGAFETFPTFSPDGKTLYFCSADSVRIPDHYDEVRYNLCAIAYDAENRSFGNRVDTLYQAAQQQKSLSFPRVSPDGRYLMFTLSAYGNFSIWHKDADLYLLDLQTKETQPLSALNSNEVDSYHSWSSNGRWVIFSSRRIDGLYTRPYIAYFDSTGKAHKPFLLPQKSVDYYDYLMKSYNIPEFITGKVNADAYTISRTAKNSAGTDLHFSK